MPRARTECNDGENTCRLAGKLLRVVHGRASVVAALAGALVIWLTGLLTRRLGGAAVQD